MCGITGYVGAREAAEVVINGLSTLEYRGYDSAGMASLKDGKISIVKTVGKVKMLADKIAECGTLAGSHCGIGHTRWATHGEPSDINSHPHGTATMQIVHNGIIENYAPLKEMLKANGYDFISATDTEVAAKLIAYFYSLCGDKRGALASAMREIVGSYAIAAIFDDTPDTIFCIRKDNPLIIGIGEGENFVASDIAAVLDYTNKYYQLGECQIAVVTKEKVEMFDIDGNAVENTVLTAAWSKEAAKLGDFDHFMIKEINEEPDAVRKTLHPRIKDMLPSFEEEKLSDERLKNIKSVTFVACGTAMHAGLVGKHLLESICRIPAKVEIASEYRYNNPIIEKDDLVIVLSQSGETADSLAALRLAKERGAYTLGIVNVIGSSIAREADNVIYTWAGPEISVASTKAYTVQASLLYLLTIRIALLRGKIDEDTAREYTRTLYEDMPKLIEGVIAREGEIIEAAKEFYNAENLFFIGRGMDYHLATEGSLKLKEISYIHSEAYAAGELKHGTISLITAGTPVIAIATIENLYEKMISNIREVKARGARVLLIANEDAKDAASEAMRVISLPNCNELFSAIPLATVLQMLAYHIAKLRGCDIDQPRNLAKSVTVE